MARHPDPPGFRSRQDWDFSAVGNNELVVACGYEYARESVMVSNLFKEWVRLGTPRAALFERATEKQIALKDVHRALLNYVKVMRVEQYRRTYGKPYPDWPQELRERVKRDFTAALKLLSDLSTQFHEVACCERDVEMIESCDGEHVGAPGLRFLAKYFVADAPWLLIPKADRDNAIASARKHQFIFFRVVPLVESVDEWQEKIRSGEALPVTRPSERDVQLRIRSGSDTAIDEGFVQWRKQHPPENKAKATARGRRSSSWWLALKELAAMRLSHFLSSKDAIETFRKYYGPPSLDDSYFWKLRRDSFSTFQLFCDTGEEPRHAGTWAKRKRGGLVNKRPPF